jgi:hypothetical protein
MSVFSNPASKAKENAGAYVKALLDMLGEDDPLDAYDELVPALEKTLRGLSDADLRRAEKPGKWSILQVLNHLADTEIVYGWRVRMIVTHDEPPIQGYDQDLWAAHLRYDQGDPREVFEELRVLRRRNRRLVRSLRPDELDRIGHHDERGRESAARVIALIAGHDRVHLRQIERIKKAIGASS